MNKKTFIQVCLGIFLFSAAIASIGSGFSLYKKGANDKEVSITNGVTTTYKLEVNKNIYTYTYNDQTGSFSTSSIGKEFTLVNDGGVYKTDWTDNTKEIYCNTSTEFTWKKYVNGSYVSDVGTTTINDEGLYTISPTYNLTNASLNTTMDRKAYYLNLSSFTDWEGTGAWFALRWYKDGTEKWYRADDTYKSGHYYRFFVESDDLADSMFIFTRMDKDKTALNWDSKWNQTQDMTEEGDKNCCEVTGWDDGFDKSPSSWELHTNE